MIQNRTNKPIYLTMQNIDEISEHDIIAWTFAQPGAMGCPGEITIITIHGNAMWLYRFSYIQNENLEVEARRRFPNKITKEPKEMKCIGMGMGNRLYLKEALVSGKVSYAAMDVVETEPIPEDSPLLSAPNVLITPHIAWAAKETRQRLMDIAVENLSAYVHGKPIHVVNLKSKG